MEDEIRQLKADNEKLQKENERLMKQVRDLEGLNNDLASQKGRGSVV